MYDSDNPGKITFQYEGHGDLIIMETLEGLGLPDLLEIFERFTKAMGYIPRGAFEIVEDEAEFLDLQPSIDDKIQELEEDIEALYSKLDELDVVEDQEPAVRAPREMVERMVEVLKHNMEVDPIKDEDFKCCGHHCGG